MASERRLPIQNGTISSSSPWMISVGTRISAVLPSVSKRSGTSRPAGARGTRAVTTSGMDV